MNVSLAHLMSLSECKVVAIQQQGIVVRSNFPRGVWRLRVGDKSSKMRACVTRRVQSSVYFSIC
jgi:hypothetical protein